MKQIKIIEADSKNDKYWKEVWEYKELFFILSWRDIKVRYKQTVLGILWSIIRPLITLVAFTIVFNNIAKLEPSGNYPYAVMVLAGLLPWQFFSTAFSSASESLITNSALLTKVFFPRIIIPASSIVTGFIDFLVSIILLLILFIYYNFLPDWKIIFLPFFTFLIFIPTLSFGLFFASLNVKYRDFRYILPFIIQVGLYITPVGFDSSIVINKWKFLFYLNPLVPIIDGFRWCILGDSNFNPFNFYGLFSLVCNFLFLLIAIKIYRTTEKSFADLI